MQKVTEWDLPNKSVYYLTYGDIGDGVDIRDFGYELTAKGHSFGPAVREYYLIHLVLRGEGKFIRSGVEHTVREGEAFLIRPMEVTTYGVPENENWEYCWIGFFGKHAKALIDYAFPSDECVVKIDKQATLAFTGQIRTVREGKIDLLNLRSTLYLLLSSARRNIVGSEKPERVGVIEQALLYLDANYFRPVTMSSLADELGVTRSYFTSLFTKSVGESPYNYLTKLRIEKAKSLFEKAGGLTASEIAYSVGFFSLERFSEMFKKYVGVSPQVYKKNLIKL